MKISVKDNNALYLNVAMAASIALILIVMIRPFFVSSHKKMATDLKKSKAPAVAQRTFESIYDIDKVKMALPKPAADNAENADLEDMYKNNDKTNVGGNMVEAWRRVKPEDKARLSDGFDKQIAASQEALKTDPKDKHAKSILYISEALKKMSVEGFNYKFKNKK